MIQEELLNAWALQGSSGKIEGIAQAMDNLGLFFGIIGVGMIVIGIVRERRARKSGKIAL